MLFVPANAVVLVFALADHFDDLAAPRWLAVESARLDPVAFMRAAGARSHDHRIQA